MNKVSVAFIGMGYRGKQLFRLLRNIPFFQILAVADPGVEPSELPDISCYNHGENSSLEMLEKHHPELVFIASPWQYHVQHALLCVEHGCHVALEVKGGLCLDEYAPLIESAERRGCHVYPLENTLFTRENLAVLNMVNEGLLGDSSLIGFFLASMTSIIFRLVRMPSPVLAYLEKMMWPLCSPPMRQPFLAMYS